MLQFESCEGEALLLILGGHPHRMSASLRKERVSNNTDKSGQGGLAVDRNRFQCIDKPFYHHLPSLKIEK